MKGEDKLTQPKVEEEEKSRGRHKKNNSVSNIEEQESIKQLNYGSP